MTARIEAARAAWSRIRDALQTEPLTEARKLADEMRRDLERQFPRVERGTKGRL